MSSFTYKVLTSLTVDVLFNKLVAVLSEVGFTLENPISGMCQIWNEEGESNDVAPSEMKNIDWKKLLPLSVQWWKGEDDIFVTLMNEETVGGTLCYLRLVGLRREEEAEIGRLLILHVVPDKREFPDDFSVFAIDAQ